MKYTIIQPTGLLDGQNANQIRREIIESLDLGINIIRIDFQEISFINSSAIGALVASLKMVRSKGGEIFLYSLNPQVRMIFELTKMDQIFKIFDDRTELNKNVSVIR